MKMRSGVTGLVIAALCVGLAACGGSSSDSGSSGSSTPQSVYVDATVEGFGSLVVDGVHYDETGATVSVDDVSAALADIKLGMTVQLGGTRSGLKGVAETLASNAAVAGPVGTVNAGAGTFTVFGMTVSTSSSTIFEGVSGVADIQLGSLVVAYGGVDYADNTVSATRVEVRPASTMGRFVDAGTVSNATATTFDMGGFTVNYSAATLYGFGGAGIANGEKVMVRATTAPDGTSIAATSVRLTDKTSLPSGSAIVAKGIVHGDVAGTSFMVNQLSVDASTAQFVNGTAATLANGKLVEVQGTANNGVLKAGTVTFVPPVPLVDKGPVTDFISAASFRVRGVVIDASGATFNNGTIDGLANGRLVEIQGSWSNGTLVATAVNYTDTSGLMATVLAGTIDSITSRFSFTLNTLSVVVSSATVYENGSSADLQAGAAVLAYGPVVSGKVLATSVVFVPVITAPHMVYGLVSHVSGSGAGVQFKLNGVPAALDSGATISGGDSASIQAGQIVKAYGALQSGTFVISALTVLTSTQALEESVCNGYAVTGPIYNFVSAENFDILGFSVNAGNASYVNGSATSLANGTVVRICGDGSATGTTLTPKRVEVL